MALAFEDFDHSFTSEPLTRAGKAAAILVAMGRETAGRLLKFFTQTELQTIIASAQTLRTVPPHELDQFVTEFAALFAEGAGLIDSAKVIESILQDSLAREDVNELVERRTAFRAYQAAMCERLKDADTRVIGRKLSREHPETAAYILSMLPSSFGATVLKELSAPCRAGMLARANSLKSVTPKAALVVEKRLEQLFAQIDLRRASAGAYKAADKIDKFDEELGASLQRSLDKIQRDVSERIRPQIFLFDDILAMPEHSRALLLNEVASDTLTMALRATSPALRTSVLNSINPQTRRLVEAHLLTGVSGIAPRDIALARRCIARQAIRMAAIGKIQLRECREASTAA